jgi:hypothetical protein
LPGLAVCVGPGVVNCDASCCVARMDGNLGKKLDDEFIQNRMA